MQKHYSAGSVFEDQQAFPSRTMFGSGCEFGPECTFGNDCRFGKCCVFGEGCEFADGCKFDGGCWFDRGCWFGVRCTFEAGCTAGEDCRYWAEDDEEHAEDDPEDSVTRWHVCVSAERHPANLTVREALERCTAARCPADTTARAPPADRLCRYMPEGDCGAVRAPPGPGRGRESRAGGSGGNGRWLVQSHGTRLPAPADDPQRKQSATDWPPWC